MLMGSYSNGDFQKRMKVSTSTFQYLCTLLGPVLKKKDTHFRESISVKHRIAIILSRLASRNSLQTIDDLFGVGLSITSIIVRECCEAIRIHLGHWFLKNQLLCG